MFKSLFPAIALLASACALPEMQTPQLPPNEDTAAMVTQNPLTIERLNASPNLSGPTASALKYSPDGARVTFLKAREDENNRYDLWQFDVLTGEQSMLVDSKVLEPETVELSEEEKALRERKRIAGRVGIVSYDWGTADTILVPIGGDLHLVTLAESRPRELEIVLTPRGEELGITFAEVSTQILSRMHGAKSQDLVRDGDEGVLIVPHLYNLIGELEVPGPDGRKHRLDEVTGLRYPDPEPPRARQLTNTDAYEYDAKVSPSETYVSFIRDGAIYVVDLKSGEESRITPLAEPEKAISYGVAEFVAQEEMGRYTGYWWSKGDRYLAYTRVNESTVDIVPRFDIAAEDVTVIEQRYPRAGRPNAIVDLFLRDMKTGETEEIDWRRDDWGSATDQYLARVNAVTGAFAVQSVNRAQTALTHQFFISFPEAHADVPAPFTTYEETNPTWVNLSDDFNDNESQLIISTEATGFRHLYELDIGQTGAINERQITSGDWAVHRLEYGSASGSGDIVYFTGYKDTPLERHLYSVPVSGGEPKRLTKIGKSWSIEMAPNGQSFVGTSSSPTEPPQTGLYNADGSLITWIEENRLDDSHPYAPYRDDHTVPDYGTLIAEDGQTLHYSIQRPPNFDASKKYPALVEVYGGPHAQTVTRNWEKMSDQFYSREGYVVFRLDNRGSTNRGKAFEDAIYHQMGSPEVRDQLVGVDWLKSLPYVDADRVGIQGWSYGGYIALMTILQAPEGTFAAAVSGAPVTDWSLYDTFYTERYMGTPQNNPDGYEKSSVFYHLERWEGDLTPLLLVHGMADDNVTFDNTTRLMAELQKRAIMFDVMTYPGQRHGIRDENLKTHLLKTRMAFLDRHLKPAE